MVKRFTRKAAHGFDLTRLASKWPTMVVGILAIFASMAGMVWLMVTVSPLEKYETTTFSLLVPRGFSATANDYSNGMTRYPFFRDGGQDAVKTTDLDITVSMWDAPDGKVQQAIDRFDDDWKNGDTQGFRNIAKRTINGYEARQFEAISEETGEAKAYGLYVYTADKIYLLAIYNYDNASKDMQELTSQIIKSFLVR